MSEITLDALEQYVEAAAKASNDAAQASKEAAEVLGSLLGEETWTPVFVNALREQLKAKGVEPPEGLTLGQLIDLVGTIETTIEPDDPDEPTQPDTPIVDVEPFKVLWERNRNLDEPLVIPEGIERIGNSVFDGCSSIPSIQFPHSLKEIGDRAFYGCSNLTDITLYDNVRRIESYAFRNCGSVLTLRLPESINRIEPYSFAYLQDLKSLTIPDQVYEIGNNAFAGLRSLETLTIPEVQMVGANVFNGLNASCNITMKAETWWLTSAVANIDTGGTILPYQWFNSPSGGDHFIVHCLDGDVKVTSGGFEIL